MKKLKNIFIEGPIHPDFIAACIQKHAAKTEIGGHSIFLGQVREDVLEGKKVQAIVFTTHKAMALETAAQIREEIINKYQLSCAHIYHALGPIKKGEICLFVFTSAAHRKAAMEACDEMVDRFKQEVAIWGKELLEDGTHAWKENIR